MDVASKRISFSFSMAFSSKLLRLSFCRVPECGVLYGKEVYPHIKYCSYDSRPGDERCNRSIRYGILIAFPDQRFGKIKQADPHICHRKGHTGSLFEGLLDCMLTRLFFHVRVFCHPVCFHNGGIGIAIPVNIFYKLHPHV